MAAAAPGELALAPNDEASPTALVEDLAGSQLELEFNHGGR